MIVEDTVDMLEFLVRNFEETFNVIPASDGQDALTRLEAIHCDLIISDVLMPKMDGFTLLTKVREDRMLSHIPFIILSALDSADSKIRGLERGADAYIEKPFSLDYLKATVESILKNRERIFEHFASDAEFQYSREDIDPAEKKWLENVNKIITDNLTEDTFCVEILARKMAISQSGLQKKLKGLTGMIPSDYIRLIRLKTAAQLLKSGKYRINEVCYMTGFNNMSYFSRRFKNQFGMLPKEYMQICQSSEASASGQDKQQPQ